METVHKRLRQILAAACVALFCALVVCVSWQVFSRYVTKNPSGYTEELAKILFVWLALLTAAYLFGESDGHMNIGFVADKARGRTKIALSILSQAAILWFAVFVLIIGGRKAVINGLRQTNPAIPQITTGHIYMALLLCGIFTAFFCLHFIIRDVREFIAGSSKAGSLEEVGTE